jgi:hypothetical protein
MHRAFILTTLLLTAGRGFAETDAQPGVDFFEKKIRPLIPASLGRTRPVYEDLKKQHWAGLPPSPQEISAFEQDSAPDAFTRAVDRLLASPQYGERWGRHWLDVACYGESTGPSRNIPYPHAWKYRDYVIDFVNSDLPFDRFIQEQIAGDLLPAETPAGRDRQLAATGFLALGVKDVIPAGRDFRLTDVAGTVAREILA